MKECKGHVCVWVIDRLTYAVLAFPVHLHLRSYGQSYAWHPLQKEKEFFFYLSSSILSLFYRNGLGPASCIDIMFRYALLTYATSSLTVNTDRLSNLWESLDPSIVWYIARATLLYLEQPRGYKKKLYIWMDLICEAAMELHRKMCWTNLSTAYELRPGRQRNWPNHNSIFNKLWF